MIYRILLLVLSFTKKETLKIFTEFFQQYASISPNVFNALYCKFRLVRLCPFFADPVTYMYVRYLCIFPNILVLTKVSIIDIPWPQALCLIKPEDKGVLSGDSRVASNNNMPLRCAHLLDEKANLHSP